MFSIPPGHTPKDWSARNIWVLVLVACLPVLVGVVLRNPPGPILQPDLPLLQDMEFRGIEVNLRGEDGSCVRLMADHFRLEAASTGRLVSASKAMVAHVAIVQPMDGMYPEWRFSRIQILGAGGPYEWFGPAHCMLDKEEDRELQKHRGSFTIADGGVVIEAH